MSFFEKIKFMITLKILLVVLGSGSVVVVVTVFAIDHQSFKLKFQKEVLFSHVVVAGAEDGCRNKRRSLK